MTLAPTSVTGTHAVALRPGRPLSGAVRVDGSKNAALPLLAAAASLRRSVQLSGVPDSSDVQLMLGLLHQCGYHIARPVADPHAVVVRPRNSAVEEGELADADRIAGERQGRGRRMRTGAGRSSRAVAGSIWRLPQGDHPVCLPNFTGYRSRKQRATALRPRSVNCRFRDAACGER